MVALGVIGAISARTVGRWLDTDRIKPWHFRSWITPKDLSSFLPRACNVLDLYERVVNHQLAPGEEVHSIDEKTSIQARHHATNEPPQPGEPARLQSTYQRKGAVNLIAALNVLTGLVFGRVYAHKSFAEFSSFLKALLDGALKRGAHCIRLILDNGSLHRPKYLQTWLAETYPNLTVIVHWLPVRSSWLNQIEIFFGILQSQALTSNDFPNTGAVESRILSFMDLRNEKAKPIDWTYTSEDLRKKHAVSPPN